MARSNEEQIAIKLVKMLGHKWGFGNLITELQKEWALMLMQKYDTPARKAVLATYMKFTPEEIKELEKVVINETRTD